ncbi:hypothetical protein JTB14_013446 [Gonioctena quinquepunctata]|nr:hypothetical protein JTB14_013446 [Gonioctena quinquepunctata]
MKSYNISLRRGVNWYRKLAIEVNAHILHQEVANEKLSIIKFKEEIVSKMCNRGRMLPLQYINILCYEKLQRESRRDQAQSKAPRTKLKCNACEKYFCLSSAQLTK